MLMNNENNIPGLRTSFWGSIYRAFQILHEGLEPAMFSLETEDYFSDKVTLGLKDRNEEENEFSLTSGEFSLQEAFERISGLNAPVNLRSVDDIVSNLNELHQKTDYVFGCYGVDPVKFYYKLILRTRRSVWKKYCNLPDSVYLVNREADSLLHSIAKLVLQLYEYHLLQNPETPRIGRLTENELLVRAAGLLILDLENIRGYESLLLNHLFHNLDNISATGYERRESNGALLLDSKHNVIKKIEFISPISLGHHRASRKILEMTTERSAALTDGRRIFGLGWFNNNSEATAQIIQFRLRGHHKWSVQQGERLLFNVIDGFPRLPRKRFERDIFEEQIRQWVHQEQVQIEALWEIVENALESLHGALIVISIKAEEEAKRLEVQCTRIRPDYLDKDVLPSVFAIDGAVLLTPDGCCYAVGVILDGSTTTSGDPARGSRYNSAVRYVKSSENTAIALVCSEDGQVNFVIP